MDAAQPQLRVVATGEKYCSPPLVHNPTGPWTCVFLHTVPHLRDASGRSASSPRADSITFSSADAPLVCRVIHARYLTAPSAVKRTGFIDVEIPKSVTFEPGDAFGIVRLSYAVGLRVSVAWCGVGVVRPACKMAWHSRGSGVL